MLKNLIKLLLTFLTLLSLSKPQNSCYAPLNTYSQPCISQTPLTGQRYTYIQYSFKIQQITIIYCRVLGMAIYGPSTPCKWGWHDLGMVNNKSFTLIWDNFVMSPAVSCLGHPLGSRVDFVWKSGVGNYSCLRGGRVLEVGEERKGVKVLQD